MELYESTAYVLAQKLTERYSTSFSVSITLLPPAMRRHIYAIYGMVRIADEIVDTYPGDDARKQLDAFYDEVMHASSLDLPYSTNPLIHAFALTAKQYGITKELIDPFFDSMRMDLTPTAFDEKKFQQYIYGSAAVVGLMCLRVFVNGDNARYDELAPGAKQLGNAYQKVNFLRDIGADKDNLKRHYFPGVTKLTDQQKEHIVDNIQADFDGAKSYISNLPISARSAVSLSYRYYQELLRRLRAIPAETLRTTRIRVPDIRKLAFYIQARVGK
jgi:phytoene synthase